MNIPVIIGSGINGLAVSRRLSYCQIPHYLIGEPIKENRPQLGESMDPVCSVEMEEKWSNFQQFFYPKQKAIFYTDGWITTCDFNFIKQKKLQIFFQVLGLVPSTQLIHVDRAGFDSPFFAETIASKNCQYLFGKVQSTVWNKETDKVTQLLLEDSTIIQPSYVFDCSNHARVLAKEINIPYEILGKQQKVVFAHLVGNPIADEEKNWLSATTLIKLDVIGTKCLSNLVSFRFGGRIFPFCSLSERTIFKRFSKSSQPLSKLC
jgi:flavin-dependent dehydrogenase